MNTEILLLALAGLLLVSLLFALSEPLAVAAPWDTRDRLDLNLHPLER